MREKEYEGRGENREQMRVGPMCHVDIFNDLTTV